MTPKRRKRLILILMMVSGVASAVGLTMYALSQNINLFYTPTQIANGEAPAGQRIRAGGMVVEDSLQRATDSLLIRFEVTDYESKVPVEFTGILPDLFREGQGIVAQGSMDTNGVFQADEVLAKHDENYMPPEVEDALEQVKKPDFIGEQP